MSVEVICQRSKAPPSGVPTFATPARDPLELCGLVIGIFLDQVAVRSDHDHRRVPAVIGQALNEFAEFFSFAVIVNQVSKLRVDNGVEFPARSESLSTLRSHPDIVGGRSRRTSPAV
jgi:hypothetical protein